MKIDIEFAELQTPLFFGKINHSNKLGTKHNLKMYWDMEIDKLFVEFQGQVAIIPMPNVASMTPKNAQDVAGLPNHLATTPIVLNERVAAPTAQPPVMPTTRKRRVSAQVATPTSHVFEGTEDKSIE